MKNDFKRNKLMERITPSKALITMIIVLLFSSFSLLAQPLVEAPVDLVNPLIGSDRCRNFFMTPAARPFGMVKLAPDTEIFGYYHTGYQNSQPTISGFSHIHEFQMGGLTVMPISGKLNPVSGPERWKSSFDPANQTVNPGYQKLHLDRYDIDVELTATKRVGFHRYTFKHADDASILIPFTGIWNEGRMYNCDVKRIGMDTIEGSLLIADSRLSTDSKLVVPTQVFFVITTDRQFKSLDGWHTQEMKGNLTGIKGENNGLILNFGKVTGGTAVKMKVAISYCSVKQALLNLTTEAPNWDFEAVRKSAREEWNGMLSRIDVTGTHDRKVKFYTNIWHCLLGRGIFSDVNGKYPVYRNGKFSEINNDINGLFPIYDPSLYTEIKSVPLKENGQPLFEMHVADAFWWSQQNLNSIWGLAYPDVLRDFCNSWLRFYDDTGILPLGASVGRIDFIMSGQQASPILGRAIQMNLPGVDANHAYEAMNATMKSGTNRWMGDVDIFTRYGGWVPHDLGEKKWSVTRTVENGLCDWVLSQAARKLGHTTEADYYNKLIFGWKNLYNPENGWLQPKDSNGSWVTPFLPLVYNTDGFLESYSTVLTWFPAQYDLEGTMQIMGGREKTIKRLDDQFKMAINQKFRNGWFQYENNTGFFHAHLFNLLGDPVKSQHWVRQVYEANYSGITTSATSYANNDEDQGQMGSLGALFSMGLFQMKGGCEMNPSYELTAPMFDRVVIHLQQDCYKAKNFVITASGNPDKNEYIETATLNGKPLKSLSITQEDINKGANLNFMLSANPNMKWAKNDK